jgi:hypothetical protein
VIVKFWPEHMEPPVALIVGDPKTVMLEVAVFAYRHPTELVPVIV